MSDHYKKAVENIAEVISELSRDLRKKQAQLDELNALIEGLSEEPIRINDDFFVGLVQLIKNLQRDANTIRKKYAKDK